MVNITPYIAKYVRQLYARQNDIVIPYEHTQFGVVLMVDVVGFSRLTAFAAEQGDAEAEAAALEIGAYLGECIDIIERFGGDVVKFLGDALLVCFQPGLTDNDPYQQIDVSEEETHHHRQQLVRKAVECGLQLLEKLSHYRVHLAADECIRARTHNVSSMEDMISGEEDMQPHRFIFDKTMGGLGDSLQLSRWNSFTRGHPHQAIETHHTDDYSTQYTCSACFPLLQRKRNRVHAQFSNSMMDDSSDKNVVDLELHIALSCGEVINIILGDRDGTAIQNDESVDLQRSQLTEVDDEQLKYFGRLEYAICGSVITSFDTALSLAKAGEMCITPSAMEWVTRIFPNLSCESRGQGYIVRARRSQNGSMYNGPRSGRYGGRHASAFSHHGQSEHSAQDQPSSYFTSKPEFAHDYNKFISYSAIHRLLRSSNNAFSAQFRDATVMFISFGKHSTITPLGLDMMQQVVYAAIKIIFKYEGVLQQFAVDDKGATILAIFGLPPLSHEREAVFAAKAAIDLRDTYSSMPTDFAISLATGKIFNAVMPKENQYRRDAAIAGDAIILAVRMLKLPFALGRIVCDFATQQQIGKSCEYDDHGANDIKGKVKPVPIYGIRKFGSGNMRRLSLCDIRDGPSFIGYKDEFKRATRFVDDWREVPRHHVLVISGPPGVGKTYFCKVLHTTMASHEVACCWMSSVEVEKGSQYYLIKHALLSLFELIDANKVPQHKRGSSSNTSPRDTSPHNMSNVSSLSLEQSSTPKPMSSIRRARFLSFSRTSRCDSVNSTDTAGLIDLILNCLRSCGEDERFLPVFKVVFAAIACVQENRYTEHLTSSGRDTLLTGVITRMIRYVSNHIPLVLVCDDLQWADSTSIRVLQHVHDHCPRVMLLFATRSIENYKIKFLRGFCEDGAVDKIALEGLGSDEIGDIIIQAFQPEVHSVSPDIVRVVQRRTGGNPLYVKNMAVFLKDYSHVMVVEKILVPSSTHFDLEDLLGNFDYRRIVKMQFDRLHTDFQEFLVIASCLEQQFSPDEIRIAIKPHNPIFSNATLVQIHDHIRRLDRYHFLCNMDSNEDNCDMFTFAHVSIPQCIYDMSSYETRRAIHQKLARHYERQLTPDNYAELLGRVSRHYLQTSLVSKQFYYLRALAELSMRSYLLPEATNHFERVVKMLDEHTHLAARCSRIHKSDIFRHLGVCYTLRTQPAEGERYLLKALECLGESWPKNEPTFFYRLWMNRFRQYRHRIFQRRWRLPWSMTPDIGRRVVDILVQLCNIYLYTGQGRSFVYACLVGLNVCEELGGQGPNYSPLLARNALLCWMNDNKALSIRYISKALSNINHTKDADVSTMCAMLYIAAGKFIYARQLLYRSIDATQTLGVVTDCQSFFRSVGLLITTRILDGTLHKCQHDLGLLKQMAATARANDDYEAEIWLSVYHITNAIVTDRCDGCEPFAILLETNAKQNSTNHCIAIHGTLLCYYVRIRHHDAARRHTRALIHLLPILTKSPNIFPIFGLIFTVIGLYAMLEDEDIELVPPGDVETYHLFSRGISYLLHAFKHVKFWEFTLPCVYLVRAFPFICTGRTFRGYEILRQGVDTLSHLQEISFLRAYYNAILGKYAPSSEKRVEWTRRAEAELNRLEIPAYVYCHPDPTQCYTHCNVVCI